MRDTYLSESPSAIPVPGAAVASDGVPRQAFVTEAVRAGRWVDSTGKVVEIDKPRLERWASNFTAMKAAGVSVPLLSKHQNDGDSDLTRGVVEDLYFGTSPTDGQPALFAKILAIGEDAITSTARNQVSIGANTFTDGTGRTWEDAIDHIALTPIPVVPGQSGPVPIAASRGGTKYRGFRLSRQESPMFDWKTIATALSLDPATLTDETAHAAITEAVGKLTPLTKQVETLNTQVANLSRSAAPTIDADILEESASLTLSRIDVLAKSGKINKAQQDKLAAFCCGTKGSRPAICLSMKAANAAGFADGKLANTILDILDLATAPKDRGEATAAQLSRGEDADKRQQELVTQQAALAGVKKA